MEAGQTMNVHDTRYCQQWHWYAEKCTTQQ